MVQNELAALTMVEMKKRDLKVIIVIAILMYVVMSSQFVSPMYVIELEYSSES